MYIQASKTGRIRFRIHRHDCHTVQLRFRANQEAEFCNLSRDIMKPKFVLFLLMGIIFFAGCTKQASVESGGVVIQEFSPITPKVASNSPVEFTLLVKNTGERTAANVKAILGELQFLPTTVKSDTEKAKYWRSESGGVPTDLLQPIAKELVAADLQSGLSGEESDVSWRLKAPIQTRDESYGVSVNLAYDYSTISNVLIKAV